MITSSKINQLDVVSDFEPLLASSTSLAKQRNSSRRSSNFRRKGAGSGGPFGAVRLRLQFEFGDLQRAMSKKYNITKCWMSLICEGIVTIFYSFAVWIICQLWCLVWILYVFGKCVVLTVSGSVQTISETQWRTVYLCQS